LFEKGVPDLRWPGFRFVIPRTFVNKQIAASVFWGFYESAEVRFIEKYLQKNLAVIELGSSLGIVSSHIVSKLEPGSPFLTVEANPYLIETIERNIGRKKPTQNKIEVLNNAIGYGRENVSIAITGNNTETRVIQEGHATAGTVSVKTLSLADLVRKIGQHEYALVSDIEGSELEWLLHEDQSLVPCRQLFIELHDTNFQGKYYTIDMVKEIIINKHGFSVADEHGPVVYFSK